MTRIYGHRHRQTFALRKSNERTNRQIVHPHCGLVCLRRPELFPAAIELPPIPKFLQPKSFDPELLYVECGRCGAPVIWEKGKATALLLEAGIDPMELDSSCLLVTDACPMCSRKKKQYTVQIYRISTSLEQYAQMCGNA